MNKIKICLIIPSLRNGGSERVMSELANHWCLKKNIEIYLILLTNQEQFYTLNPLVNVITPNRNYNSNILSKMVYKAWTLSYIRFSCNRVSPDVVLSFSERYNNIVLLSLLRTEFRVFVSDRNNPYMNIGKIHKFLRNKLYKNASGIIAQTETAKKVLSKNTRNKNIKVIPNPLREISNISEVKKGKNKKIILNVGRNVSQKNQLELLDIFSRTNYKEWELKILGNGPLRASLIQKVQKLNLQKNVQILEFNKNIDIFYSEASIFAFSSLFEGFPNALNEAMAHGLPSISYDCPTGPSDIIKDRVNGMLVDLNDRNQFVEKLNILMESEELRNAYSNEAKKVKEKYSLKIITDKYLKFILGDDTNN